MCSVSFLALHYLQQVKHSATSSMQILQNKHKQTSHIPKSTTMQSTTQFKTEDLIHPLLGAWASLLDLGRKGDAHLIESLANDILEPDQFSLAIDNMLEAVGIDDDHHKELAKDGFWRIAFGERVAVATKEEKREMAVEYLVNLSAMLLAMRRAGLEEKVGEVGERLIGQEAFEAKVAKKVDEQ